VVVLVVETDVEVDVEVEVEVPLSLPPQATVSELNAIAAVIAAANEKRRGIRRSVMFSTCLPGAGRLRWLPSCVLPIQSQGQA
jgi:hypothetical protein